MLEILIIGCGAIGGYFGGRLLEHEAARVTFLLRTREKAEHLQNRGLVIHSPFAGDLRLPNVASVVFDLATCDKRFDLVILTCKAPALDSCLESLARYRASADYLVLPLLNGVQHFDKLDSVFGKARVLGGVARISTVLNAQQSMHVTTIDHLTPLQNIIFGARHESGSAEKVLSELESALKRCPGLAVERTQTVEVDLWEKFVTLTTLAGATCLCRGTIGQILHCEEGARVLLGLLEECTSAVPNTIALRPERMKITKQLFLEDRQSQLTSSMFRDMQQGVATEAREIVRDMLLRVRRAEKPAPMLTACWLVLEMHENAVASSLL